MAIITLKAWYLRDYEPARELEKRPHDLRLSKSSLLKSALRADFLDEVETVRESEWFQRYLSGEGVEFYIEGSGGYSISNIDLISHEIYFAKREVMSHLDPVIFFSYQTDYDASTELLREELKGAIAQFNKTSRLPLSLEEANRLSDGPLRLQSSLMAKLRKSLIFIGDVTPIAALGEDARPLPSPIVCVETGYALQCKRPEQILLGHMTDGGGVGSSGGQFPYDITSEQRFQFKDAASLKKTLRPMLEDQLRRFSLLS
ncbi:MAG: hypothetical protein HC824_04805 [Synechococcales cyanobacterium RM1_1_8]|nr:hypothetical protein [Synechococcales cyanobacterium RM1_1_8]